MTEELNYQAWLEKAQAMTKEQQMIVITQMPDELLMREMLRRFEILRDYKDAYERVPIIVERAHDLKPTEDDWL